MQSLLELQNVSKSYRRGKETVPVLENLSLSLFPGEFLSITGPSGSGKSTLMNLLGCLDLPDSGRCLLSGRDLSLCSETELSRIRNREIGFIFQGFHLIPALTAYENVELPFFTADSPAVPVNSSVSAPWSRWGFPTGPPIALRSFPAASSSGSLSPGPSPPARR